MILDDLNVDFIHDNVLKNTIIDFLHQVHVDFQSSALSSREKDTMIKNMVSEDKHREDTNIETNNIEINNTIIAISANYVQYNPEEFLDSDSDWNVWTSQDKYLIPTYDHNHEYSSFIASD